MLSGVFPNRQCGIGGAHPFNVDFTSKERFEKYISVRGVHIPRIGKDNCVATFGFLDEEGMNNTHPGSQACFDRSLKCIGYADFALILF